MKIFPAIDLLDQKVVRLYQGDYQQKEVFGDDPVAFAQAFEQAGANYLHLVDLDGAKAGKLHYFETAQKIVENTNLFVEVGGGIRDEETIKHCLSAGVDRVILGTIAQKNPAFTQAMLKKYRNKIAIGVDAKDGKVAVEGWLEKTATDAFDFCQQLVVWGAETIIFTEIARDGTGEGINLPLYQKLNQLEAEIVASGGVASLNDIEGLKQLGISGAIVGKSLYNEKLKLEDVLAAGREEH
ncbi:1-(5-phosphoribosyl)-5-[(5-phosphoribosylamino)methylideneamino]imidazole-4-carboxamide isomerase [Enterococcus xiangfangensis]|uniref:1-(5-phosphoribosyl)-5-[(5- phosphoribosylamino)methylideneamino]imidazole-4- carboxamide isomerase n=1 Tax=Enterococcus xiangfangensis TaxID=1296537 RepID=UPI0010F62696|nr:1-(5-phosphoribosyl)-5-[(5-phosphoribosylamino)methylideneamino]imidazole-4-carboxamide isomerase [Enterococcus xiangfangensis]MBM7712575.1 phosphoribosylformimino-5-aminoimidazole carboxamide ribotide isomerase [Enterococcus xiangfangensis]NBK08704.1 1-(5-phosphoribosyl)-5-[(5-phosphoribosylamino)methylideneamino]imidazole-4-carboxamide isomerase [Enterococcus asini]